MELADSATSPTPIDEERLDDTDDQQTDEVRIVSIEVEAIAVRPRSSSVSSGLFGDSRRTCQPFFCSCGAITDSRDLVNARHRRIAGVLSALQFNRRHLPVGVLHLMDLLLTLHGTLIQSFERCTH